MTIPQPPVPFVAHTLTLPAGTALYHVHSNCRDAAEFNPGLGPHGRFSFFGTPPVPVLYAAETEAAAICETLLHDIPLAGGFIEYCDYTDKVAARLVTRHDLALAKFLGTGLRALGIEAGQLTDTPASAYPEIVKWAQGAHAAGYDGIAWMSKRCNSDRAYVLFGDRTSSELRQDPSYGRVFTAGADLMWLVEWCATVRVDVYPPP